MAKTRVQISVKYSDKQAFLSALKELNLAGISDDNWILNAVSKDTFVNSVRDLSPGETLTEEERKGFATFGDKAQAVKNLINSKVPNGEYLSKSTLAAHIGNTVKPTSDVDSREASKVEALAWIDANSISNDPESLFIVKRGGGITLKSEV
jgi:hypothetical protein